ncbi:low affinity immunoglobulin gamma Fc region receptor III-like [Chaetodon auriga]|uniref:low affinity immunoglobulin gamma Fc region receptor III-like n=1 Tax=Chaetodon auriga TaxID=39042 RepID=UPI004032D25B
MDISRAAIPPNSRKRRFLPASHLSCTSAGADSQQPGIMGLTALCSRLLMVVLVLLVAQNDYSYFAEKTDAAFPRVSPDRLQFFEYESISLSCEEFGGLTEWRVMRKPNKINPTDSANWNSSAPSCTIGLAFERHSGDYWCEDAEGERSGAVNITVTAGPVILQVTARPVEEGFDVILHCRNKKSQSEHIADFFKDGFHLGTQYKSNMTIQNFSKSDEGLYKCRISGAGESPESRLTVFHPSEVGSEETRPSHSQSPDLLFLLWIVGFVPLLLLLVMGLRLSGKHRGNHWLNNVHRHFFHE